MSDQPTIDQATLDRINENWRILCEQPPDTRWRTLEPYPESEE